MEWKAAMDLIILFINLVFFFFLGLHLILLFYILYLRLMFKKKLNLFSKSLIKINIIKEFSVRSYRSNEKII